MGDIANLPESWKVPLGGEWTAPYMQDLRAFLRQEMAEGKQIFPKPGDWLGALEMTPLNQVRVVILGQDPYHKPGQAHGLCFSVPPGNPIPPSLRNIYKELQADLGIAPARHGHLDHWANQGVLLLNSVLTVELAQAASHKGRGWERFTDAIIQIIDARQAPVVFLLWGSYAQKKAAFVDTSRHRVLNAAHPSPLSAHNGFHGCRHFSQANEVLTQMGMPPINWELPESV